MKTYFLAIALMATILTACNPTTSGKPTPTPATETPTPTPVSITFLYHFENLPPWFRQIDFPTSSTTTVEYSNGGWGPIHFGIIETETTLFNLKEVPPEYLSDATDCFWSMAYYDDYSQGYNIRFCETGSPGEIEIPVTVSMAYCSSYENGLYCRKNDLSVFIEDTYLTFSAEGTFRPEYRLWVEEVIDFFGVSNQLPPELEPDHAYTIYFH